MKPKSDRNFKFTYVHLRLKSHKSDTMVSLAGVPISPFAFLCSLKGRQKPEKVWKCDFYIIEINKNLKSSKI